MKNNKKIQNPIVPVKFYSNAEAEKAKILQENNKKSGIYL
jgi:hypothetical protein